MSRTTQIKCDWCEATDDGQPDNEMPIEQGWIEVALLNAESDELEQLDFCSRECVGSYFG